MGAEDEDLETHYNLGIAFREMGLVDEAISEFQKVAKAYRPRKALPLRHAVLHPSRSRLHGKGPARHRRHLVRACSTYSPVLNRKASSHCGMI